MSGTSALGGAQAAFVERARVARLGTTMLDGTPHVVPVCPVLDLDRILIASAFDRKVANIRDNPAVCIAFDDYSEDWEHGLAQVIVYGDAYNVFGGERNLGLFVTGKYYRSGDTTAVTRVDPAPNWDFKGPTLPDRVAFPTSFQFLRNEAASLNVKLDYKLAKESTVSFSGGYTNFKRPKDDMRPRLDGGTRTPNVGPILSESTDKLWVFRNQQMEFLRQVVNNQVETWRWNLQGDHRLSSVHITWDLTYSPSKAPTSTKTPSRRKPSSWV